MKKSIILTFWALSGIFLVVLAEFLFPPLRNLLRGSELFLIPPALFSLLGLILLVLALKQGTGGKINKFLILTGASATGFFVTIVLHNLFYALGILASHITVLKYLMEAFHIAFFIIAIFICPAGFFVGVIGVIWLLIKQRKQS